MSGCTADRTLRQAIGTMSTLAYAPIHLVQESEAALGTGWTKRMSPGIIPVFHVLLQEMDIAAVQLASLSPFISRIKQEGFCGLLAVPDSLT